MLTRFLSSKSLILIACAIIGILIYVLYPTASSIPGYIEGRFTYLAPTQAGIVTEIYVKPGDLVTQGQAVLKQDPMPERETVQLMQNQLASTQAKLNDLEKGRRPEEIQALEAAVDQAKADLKYAKAEYHRSQELVKRNAVSQDQLERDRASYEKIQAQITELQAQLAVGKLPAREDQVLAAKKDVQAAKNNLTTAQWHFDQKTMTVTAPGKIIDVYVRPGDYLAPGAPGLQFLAQNQVFVNVYVPQDQLNKIKHGQKIAFRLDGDKKWRFASIVYISPMAEYTPPTLYTQSSRQKFVYLVRATPDESPLELHPGQPIDIDLTAHD